MTRVLPILLAATLLLGGCIRQADISEPRQFRDHGIAFDYPKNWKITKDKPISSAYLIQVEGPGSVITILSVFKAKPALSLEDYATNYIDSMKQKVPFGMFKLTDKSVKPDGVDVRYTIKVASVDVPFTANLSRHELGDVQIIGITQISDEDRHFVQPGFDLILKSLAAAPPAK